MIVKGMGARIRAARMARNMTQDEVEHEAGLGSRGHLSKVEGDKVGVEAETLCAIAQAVGEDPIWLLSGRREMRAETAMQDDLFLGALAELDDDAREFLLAFLREVAARLRLVPKQ